MTQDQLFGRRSLPHTDAGFGDFVTSYPAFRKEGYYRHEAIDLTLILFDEVGEVLLASEERKISKVGCFMAY